MQDQCIRLIAPSILGSDGFSEAEILGAFVFLWNQHPSYKQSSIESALENIIPIIRNKNFCLFIKNGKPQGYINWVFMDENEAVLYVQQENNYLFCVENYAKDVAGKQLWILTAFFPFGDIFSIRNLLKSSLLKDKEVRYINSKSCKRKQYRGVDLEKIFRSKDKR